MLEFTHRGDSYIYANTLRKQAYSNVLKILPPQNDLFQIKDSDTSDISA